MASRYSDMPSRDSEGWTPVIDNKSPDIQHIIVEVNGISATIKADKKPGLTSSGATVTFSGFNLVEFTLAFTAWENVGQRLIHEYARLLYPTVDPKIKERPNTNARIQPVNIYHPTLTETLQVSSFFCESLTGPEWDKTGHLWHLTAKCCQWAAPPAKGGSSGPKASTPYEEKPVFGQPADKTPEVSSVTPKTPAPDPTERTRPKLDLSGYAPRKKS